VLTVRETKIFSKKIELRNPILIVGLPGIGNIGSLVVQYLIQQLGAKEFATLYSPHLPYFVVALDDGGFRLVSDRFYYYKNKDKNGSDLVLLIGDYQPATSEGQYDVNDQIVKFFKSIGGKVVYTIGGYASGDNKYVANPRVFGVSADKKLRKELEKHNVIFGAMPNLSIIGAAGLVVAFAKMHGLPAACLMGETGMLDVDANASKKVLEVLSKILKIDIDLKDITKLQTETEKLVKELQEAAADTASKQASNPNYIK